jgi:hypothetical protein
MAGGRPAARRFSPLCRLNNGDSVDRCSLGVVFVRKIIHQHATNIAPGRVVAMVAPSSVSRVTGRARLRNC